MEIRTRANGEVHLSYVAIRDDPDFFGHPFAGWTTPKSARNSAYPMAQPDPLVEICVYDAAGRRLHRRNVHPLNMVDYELKHEIRITVPVDINRDIPTMSLLIMTKNPTPLLDYRLEFHSPGSPMVTACEPELVNTLPSGGAVEKRRWGWR